MPRLTKISKLGKTGLVLPNYKMKEVGFNVVGIAEFALKRMKLKEGECENVLSG